MELLPLWLSWVSRASPDVLGATSVQSPGSHCSGSAPPAGLQDQSCGPVVVFRAANRRPPNATMPGTARCQGSSAPSAVESTVTEDRPLQEEGAGGAVAQVAQPLEGQGVGAPAERAMPPLLAT